MTEDLTPYTVGTLHPSAADHPSATFPERAADELALAIIVRDVTRALPSAPAPAVIEDVLLEACDTIAHRIRQGLRVRVPELGTFVLDADTQRVCFDPAASLRPRPLT